MTPLIRIQTEDFDIAAEIAALSTRSGDVGAIATFTGHVRADDGLTALMLEHYPAMTEREIARHVSEAENRWPLLGVTIIHRIGRLVPGDRIVFVAVALVTSQPSVRGVRIPDGLSESPRALLEAGRTRRRGDAGSRRERPTTTLRGRWKT